MHRQNRALNSHVTPRIPYSLFGKLTGSLLLYNFNVLDRSKMNRNICHLACQDPQCQLPFHFADIRIARLEKIFPYTRLPDSSNSRHQHGKVRRQNLLFIRHRASSSTFLPIRELVLYRYDFSTLSQCALIGVIYIIHPVLKRLKLIVSLSQPSQWTIISLYS